MGDCFAPLGTPLLPCDLMAHNPPAGHGHVNSMTELAQWGQFSENVLGKPCYTGTDPGRLYHLSETKAQFCTLYGGAGSTNNDFVIISQDLGTQSSYHHSCFLSLAHSFRSLLVRDIHLSGPRSRDG